ncbi:hypothetical protein TNCV_985421 [Trichonephila clavipes]|nr:hypothetical protein TNCV_985421 [Trichonephila clavipes]
MWSWMRFVPRNFVNLLKEQLLQIVGLGQSLVNWATKSREIQVSKMARETVSAVMFSIATASATSESIDGQLLSKKDFPSDNGKGLIKST